MAVLYDRHGFLRRPYCILFWHTDRSGALNSTMSLYKSPHSAKVRHQSTLVVKLDITIISPNKDSQSILDLSMGAESEQVPFGRTDGYRLNIFEVVSTGS
jgi:hypothetical protein